MMRAGYAGNAAEASDVPPLSVSEFLARINDLLADQVAWIEGEVTDLRLSQGRWIHFDLKDAESLLHCFGLQFRLRVPLEDGMKVRVWGVPRVYPKYGRLSFVVERIELSGEGALRRAFELLKARLDAEGLFAPERKRLLPRFPERIGLITSPEAAAYSDFLKVLKARRGGMEILFVPVSVQGRDAPEHILAAIEHLNETAPALDALILVRGGGSLEDLHAFNDERVVRALARSRIPTLVGVGHERDVTLADLAADCRGSTPSNAAELLTPTRVEILAGLSDSSARLHRAVTDALASRERKTQEAVRILRQSARDALDHVRALAQRMAGVGRLLMFTVQRSASEVARGEEHLRAALNGRLLTAGEGVSVAERVLLSLHPVRVLARGFSITKDDAGHVLRDASVVHPESRISTVLHRGTLTSVVTSPSPWPGKTASISRKRTKSSRRLSSPLSQATLI